MLISLLSKG